MMKGQDAFAEMDIHIKVDLASSNAHRDKFIIQGQETVNVNLVYKNIMDIVSK